MSEREETPTDAEPRMRRRLLGYRPADVEEALEARDSTLNALEDELDERDAELEQLRQDIAALWLAFAQHDRMITDLTEVVAATGAAARVATELAAAATGGSPAPPAEASPPDEGAEVPTAAATEEPDPPVGHQLAELDEVLAAIEMATQTLEQTYADEVREAEAGATTQPPSQPSAEETEPEAEPDPDEDEDDAEEPATDPSGED